MNQDKEKSKSHLSYYGKKTYILNPEIARKVYPDSIKTTPNYEDNTEESKLLH